jgi:hypothetical protein
MMRTLEAAWFGPEIVIRGPLSNTTRWPFPQLEESGEPLEVTARGKEEIVVVP